MHTHKTIYGHKPICTDRLAYCIPLGQIYCITLEGRNAVPAAYIRPGPAMSCNRRATHRERAPVGKSQNWNGKCPSDTQERCELTE